MKNPSVQGKEWLIKDYDKILNGFSNPFKRTELEKENQQSKLPVLMHFEKKIDPLLSKAELRFAPVIVRVNKFNEEAAKAFPPAP